MEGVYYKNGVYVLIDTDKMHEDCVYHYHYRDNVLLNGGRVRMKYASTTYRDTAFLFIDGIEIINLNNLSEDENQINKALNLSTIVQYLNAIEINGVEAFLQNYKESLEQLQVNLKDLKKEKESELSTITEEPLLEEVKQEIKNIKKLLCYLFTVLFNLSLFICAGLENEKIISVYQSIIETIA